MPAADDAPDGFVYGAAHQLRHELISSLTTISARSQLLVREIRRSPFLREEEQTRMLASLTAIEAAVQAMCAVIDTIKQNDRGR